MVNLLSINLMYVILDIVNQTYTGLPLEDDSRLDLVEIRPRSEEFADVPLSVSISPNDPADSTGWMHTEITSPGAEYNKYEGTKFVELGLGQPWNYRYTVDFTFFFQERGFSREKALEVAMLILARIHQAVILEGENGRGKIAQLRRGDDLGFHLVRGSNAVKRYYVVPRGSRDETLYRGKMWLQFEAYLEPQRKEE